MFYLKLIFYFILLHIILSTPQFNLHYTNWIDEKENDNYNGLPYYCLRVIVETVEDNVYGINSYCLSEFSSKFNIDNNDFLSKLTFADLLKKNISSEQLYFWSTPIDIIEDYQLYLNQLSTLNNSILENKIFYNCTLPRFGPKCQFQFNSDFSLYHSLNYIISEIYDNHVDSQTTLTCYKHLQCNRGISSACLDWSNICNGQIDCIDGGFDEENCWQLEINQCQDDEYRCKNGQCIPLSFFRENLLVSDCIDRYEKVHSEEIVQDFLCPGGLEPKIPCEDSVCERQTLTSSCSIKQENLLFETFYSNKNNSITENCWLVFKCLLNSLNENYLSCDTFYDRSFYIEIIKKICPDLLYFPNVPILFGDLYFAIVKNDTYDWNDPSDMSFYVCYNNSYYNDYLINVSKIFVNNMICINIQKYFGQLNSTEDFYELYKKSIRLVNVNFKKYHVSFNYNSMICNRSNMYQCIGSSKCISIYRLMDTVNDCPYMDDENMNITNNSHLIKQMNKNYFKCEINNKYIFRSYVEDFICHCEVNDYNFCEDEDLSIAYTHKILLFQYICDGYIDLIPEYITGRNETDETECEQWKCNNIYTRCNRIKNCPNGEDEIDCFSSSTLYCPSNYSVCVSPRTNQFICLPMNKTNDGIVDCLGATDEPTLCYRIAPSKYIRPFFDFYCANQSRGSCISSFELCNVRFACQNGDDEQFCDKNRTYQLGFNICHKDFNENLTNVEQFLCNSLSNFDKRNYIHFTLNGTISPVKEQSKPIENTLISTSSMIRISNEYHHRCHRGLDLRIWLKNLTRDTCLCPLNYYGDQCQYQNQRIILTIIFQTLSDSRQTVFAIIISLIDDSNDRIIHSYEQITYLSTKHCKHKFYIYLIYSTRPKNSTKQYAIHIDIYEKINLLYRGSVLLPVHFPFLPVHRLSTIVYIPQNNRKTQNYFNDQCIHGKSIKYSNNPQNFTFCQCDQDWSGRYCTIKHSCNCSSDSLCIGITPNNQSICVCPLHKFGRRCLLIDTTCKTNNKSICENNGQCIPNDDYLIPRRTFVCICLRNFTGDKCQIPATKLVVSFDKNIDLSEQMLIHFIEVKQMLDPFSSTIRSTTFRTIPLRQDSITIYWSQPFHLVFIELFTKIYYLTIIQTTYQPSKTINKSIDLSDRCLHINELFNQTFLQWNLIRRIKYYHIPCQNQTLNLSCFYDEIHFCLCYYFEYQYLVNCFKFNHNMSFNCKDRSECENGGQCLEDDEICPIKTICKCLPCFYGRKCQFRTSGFGLSLDAILSYHILPDVNIYHQTIIVKFSLGLTIIFIIIGLMNGILSLITFKSKIIREVGCGLYLLGSSITCLITIIIFGLKFFILLFTQMNIISNKSFLSIQCYSIDFLLRIFLNMDQWLSACVAMERAVTTIKGTNFLKKKSKQTAKYLISILFILMIGTCIHDPISRQLIDEINDEDNMKRTWCIVRYGIGLQVYNNMIHTIHFMAPFLINIISAIILIRTKSRQQLNIHRNDSYTDIFWEQLKQHKHLLTAPIVLIILGVPRLILTYISKCMNSTNDAWLFLIGFFISFIPPLLTFVVFISPSKFYKKEFRKNIMQFRKTLRICCHLQS